MQILWLLWSIRSLIDRFNIFYSYLYGKIHIPYDKSHLKIGQLCSRVAKSESYNIYGILHYQHFGVIVDVDDVPLILHITSTDGVHVSTIDEYMDGERILHLYHHNPYIDIRGIEDTKYSFLLSNCEHLATKIVDGVARSRQVEAMEYLSTHDDDPPLDMKLIPSVSLYI